MALTRIRRGVRLVVQGVVRRNSPNNVCLFIHRELSNRVASALTGLYCHGKARLSLRRRVLVLMIVSGLLTCVHSPRALRYLSTPVANRVSGRTTGVCGRVFCTFRSLLLVSG